MGVFGGLMFQGRLEFPLDERVGLLAPIEDAPRIGSEMPTFRY